MDRSEGGLTGGPDSATTVGPQLIVLTNGDQLDVPAETPGGVYCAELYHPSLHVGFEVDPKNWFSHCVVMGQRTAGGEVAWFEIRRIRTYNESALVDVGYVAEMDTTANTLTTTDGIEFLLVADESDCGEPLGVTAAMRALADRAVAEFGSIDVMVNNAGTMPLALYADHAQAAEAWDRCIDVNFKGVLHGIMAVYDAMIEQGRGHIINLSSIYGNYPVSGAAVYGATKAAVNVLSESLRQETQGRIKVTTIRPTGVPGTGLGLAISKKLVDAHGGSLEAESRPGQGTEFVLTFPKQSGSGEA